MTVSSSVILQELLDFFLEHHICFESNAILRNVTVGGIISTGVHVSIVLVLDSCRHTTCTMYTFLSATCNCQVIKVVHYVVTGSWLGPADSFRLGH